MPNETASFRGVEYLTRAGWGADESFRFKADGTENSLRTYYPAHTLTAHHTAGANGDLGPAAAARASLTRLLAALADYHGLDPEAAVTFVNPVNGVTKGVRTISGHRDRPATECPGTTL